MDLVGQGCGTLWHYLWLYFRALVFARLLVKLDLTFDLLLLLAQGLLFFHKHNLPWCLLQSQETMTRRRTRSQAWHSSVARGGWYIAVASPQAALAGVNLAQPLACYLLA